MFSPSPQLSIAPATVVSWKKVSQGDPLAVNLDTVKTFVNRPIEDTFFDAELTTFIRVATAEIERVARIDLTAKVWTGTLFQFWPRILLNKRPFVTVNSVGYVDASTREIKTANPTLYVAAPNEQMTGMIHLGDSLNWPPTALRPDAVRITVKSGFAVTQQDKDAGYPEMPEEIRHALLMTISAMEAKRGDEAGSGGGSTTVYAMKNARGGNLMPPEAKSLIADYVYRWVTI
jgi:hypothetical protein